MTGGLASRRIWMWTTWWRWFAFFAGGGGLMPEVSGRLDMRGTGPGVVSSRLAATQEGSGRFFFFLFLKWNISPALPVEKIMG